MASANGTLLVGKTAIVTGGTRNIGGGISEELARRGANVAMVYANPAKSAEADRYAGKLSKLGGGVKAVAILADVSDEASPAKIVKETLEKLQVETIDIVVNNAAAGDYSATEDITLDRFDNVFNTNVRGPFFLVKEALPYIPKGGRIINIASIITRGMAVGPGFPPVALYTASKIAIEGLTYAWAAEFGRSRGINVNAVCVGFVATDLLANMPDEQREQIKEYNASRSAAANRVGEPDDVAQVVAFLAGESSKWVTGSTVSANGGMVII